MEPPRKSVLIVDDDPETRQLLLRLLKSEDLELVTCSTGADAADLLASRDFNVVLLDLGLPDKHGLEVLEECSQVDGPRFLIVTGDDNAVTMMQAIKNQAYGYIKKPFDPVRFVEIVREALVAPELPPIEVISAKPDWLELSVPCSRNAAERVDEFIRQLSSLPEELDQVSECFRELLMNAVEWGGGLDPHRRVRIAFLRTPRMLQYRISDPGEGFRFAEIPHAAVGQHEGDLTSHAEVRKARGLRAGGFGLLMVKAMADELLFNEKQNEVVFIKYLPEES